jgi:hypothetical protein
MIVCEWLAQKPGAPDIVFRHVHRLECTYLWQGSALSTSFRNLVYDLSDERASKIRQ